MWNQSTFFIFFLLYFLSIYRIMLCGSGYWIKPACIVSINVEKVKIYQGVSKNISISLSQLLGPWSVHNAMLELSKWSGVRLPLSRIFLAGELESGRVQMGTIWWSWGSEEEAGVRWRSGGSNPLVPQQFEHKVYMALKIQVQMMRMMVQMLMMRKLMSSFETFEL